MSLRRVRRCWEGLAETDPLWAVLSDPSKRGNRWDPDEFFLTGEREVSALLDELERRGLAPRRETALDFGCGVGRLTQALAARFESSHGVDVSAGMIEQARRHNRHGERCHYHLNPARRLPFRDHEFDFALSLITLQHMPPRLAAGYLREFLRVLRPGGVLLFQLPAEPVVPAAGGSGARALARRIVPTEIRQGLRAWIGGARPPFEMHGMPRPRVERLLARNGGRVVDAVEDRGAGDGWTGFRYTVVKPGGPF